MSAQDKRASPRVNADFTLRFETVDQFALAYGTEISTGGMFLATTEPLPIGSELQVRLVLPETFAEITLRASVAHVRSVQAADAAGLPAGMGVRFLDRDPATQAKLEGFVAERMAAQEARTAKAAARKGISVLIVDDDPTYQQLISAAFSGDVVRLAGNGFEALALLGREVPNVIVSDVQMPKMDGWQLLRLLRTKPQFATVPVLFTTTLNSEADRLRGYKLGVDDYIAKPFRVAELRARVDRLLMRTSVPPPAPSAPAAPAPAAPAPVAPAQARSLRGDLAHVSLASVLSLLELERRTGRLNATSGVAGTLSLHDGMLVDASLGGGKVKGKAALFAMLGWNQGDFEFVLCDVPSSGAGEKITYLLLEHAQRTDEQGR